MSFFLVTIVTPINPNPSATDRAINPKPICSYKYILKNNQYIYRKNNQSQ
jgi:hypothetical protein